MREVQGWVLLGLDRQSLIHATRTTVAAVASLYVARLCRLPEAYWAAVTTLVVMQSSLGAALKISGERLAGTALVSSGRRTAGRQVRSEYYRVRGRRFCSGIALLHSASRAQCLPLCRSHASHRDARAAR
jgi:hypothetical protein